MNDKDWQILLTIANAKNMTVASNRLYITQPALTYRLKNIEKELGAAVFLRTPKGLVLTPEGEAIVKYAKTMLKEFESIRTRVSNMSGTVQGTLRLGLSLNFARFKLSKILTSFCQLYPQVDLSIKTALSSQVKTDLENDDITVAIVRGEHVWSEVKHMIDTEPIYLVSNQQVPPKLMPKLPYIMYDADASLNTIVADWWNEKYSSPPRVAMQINDADTCRQMAALGLGYTIIPAMNTPSNTRAGLNVVPLTYKNNTPLDRKTYVLCRNTSLKLPAVAKFIEHVLNMT